MTGQCTLYGGSADPSLLIGVVPAYSQNVPGKTDLEERKLFRDIIRRSDIKEAACN